MELPLSSPAKCELRSVIRFLNAKNNSPVEIHRLLVEVYGEKCMDIKNVRKWCRDFNEGRINVHDEQRSGRPSLPESTVARIDEMVRANRRITLEEIEDGLNEDCSHFSVHKIVSETLGYRKVSARWVDKWLKEAAGEWYNTGNTKFVDRMKKMIEHQDRRVRHEIRAFSQVFWIVFDFYLLKKKMDQRTCIEFCVKNEIECADAFRMLTVAYGEATLDRNNVYLWYKMFSEGREDVNDEERAGSPSTSTTDEKINEVEKMILANRRITVREVAEDINISIGSCHSIFINDLGMRRVAAKFVPKLLNCDQKQHRMNIANEMLDSVRDDPNLLQRVITGDEAWVYGYDVETKAQSSQWKLPHEPRPKKARQVRSNVKVLLTVLFDCRGVVHHEFLPQGRTVNKEYYLQVMRNLREAIRQKRPDLRKNKNWLLHHDNAPAHTSLLVRDFLTKNNTLMMPQPPYSPDLAPCDFFLFPKMKRPMKGRRYATLDEMKTASKEELK
ncbi:hypothetical protein LAZ67_17002447 [Cordylochernes scorpioides]|uniref:Mos1 transposase HTH domain-containing protein n=1 Tax=Cordylochernes scorpioides TaxID=51811 RepID=A0ABY6LDZ8_9ARAC|nr:hypothetical protein LAZ67_17002447 [Cordylochernes scorpioides]